MVEPFKPGLRSIDERALNKLLDTIPKDVTRDILRKSLPKPSNVRSVVRINDFVRLPRFIKTLVSELALLDEPDMRRRFNICLGYMRYRDYSINTVNRYLKLLRVYGVFGSNTQQLDCIQPDPTLFKSNKHTRIVDRDTFIQFIQYMSQNFSKFVAPLLLSIYTGLRTTELLQMTTYNLKQLTDQTVYVDIKRKNTSPKKKVILWKPNYLKQFKDFIGELKKLYKLEYDSFERLNVDVKLFNVTPRTLVNRQNSLFYRVTGRPLPYGYGVHGNRTTMASILYDLTPNLVAVQNFLQHENLDSTRTYVRADVDALQSQFDRTTADTFKGIIECLE